MVCYKMNLSFRCIYKWAYPHITFAHKGIAERQKANTESCSIQFARIFFVPVLGFICLIDSNFFSGRKIPFTVLTIKYKVGYYLLYHTLVLFITALSLSVLIIADNFKLLFTLCADTS